MNTIKRIQLKSQYRHLADITINIISVVHNMMNKHNMEYSYVLDQPEPYIPESVDMFYTSRKVGNKIVSGFYYNSNTHTYVTRFLHPADTMADTYPPNGGKIVVNRKICIGVKCYHHTIKILYSNYII